MAEERGGMAVGGATERVQAERQAEVQSLLVRLRQYQAQAEGTLQQLNIVNQAIEEHNRAIETIKYLRDLENGDELLVPVGAGSYIYAKLSDVSRIIVRIGGGISAEKDPESAIKHLEKKREELERSQQEMTNILQRIEMEAQKIQARLQEIAGGGAGVGTAAEGGAGGGAFGGGF